MFISYLSKKPPVPTKWAIIILIKVKSWNALLRMLLLGISSSQKLALSFKFLILDVIRTLSISMRKMWESVIIFRSQKEHASKNVWETLA